MSFCAPLAGREALGALAGAHQRRAKCASPTAGLFCRGAGSWRALYATAYRLQCSWRARRGRALAFAATFADSRRRAR